jgi:hypothetical protein
MPSLYTKSAKEDGEDSSFPVNSKVFLFIKLRYILYRSVLSKSRKKAEIGAASLKLLFEKFLCFAGVRALRILFIKAVEVLSR